MGRPSPSSPASAEANPAFATSRITVYDILEYMASGMSQEDILRDFPDLIREDLQACLAFAADRERRLVALPPA